MGKDKKALIKSFKTVVEDLLDNYEQYNQEEKNQIKALFCKVSDLNVILDKYDIETDFSWQEYFDSVSRYFGAN